MMYEMSRRKSEPILLLTQGIFNHPHLIGMVLEELAFDDTVSYTQCTVGKWIAAQLSVIAMSGIRTPVHSVTYPAL